MCLRAHDTCVHVVRHTPFPTCIPRSACLFLSLSRYRISASLAGSLGFQPTEFVDLGSGLLPIHILLQSSASSVVRAEMHGTMSGDRSLCVAGRTIYGFCWTLWWSPFYVAWNFILQFYLLTFCRFRHSTAARGYASSLCFTFGHRAVQGSPDPSSGQPPGAESVARW